MDYARPPIFSRRKPSSARSDRDATVAEMAAVIDERQKDRMTEEELERILTE
jgi:hypothetical protein